MRSLYVDRELPGVGRLRRAIGSDERVMVTVYSRMVTLLFDEARLDVLRGLKDGRLSFREVREAIVRFAPEAANELSALESKLRRAAIRQPQLYAILRRDTAEVKLGISDDLARRFRHLQAAHAVRLELLGTWPGTLRNERAIHHRFAADRLLGEWFRYTAEIAEWIDSQLRPTIRSTNGKQNGPDALGTEAASEASL